MITIQDCLAFARKREFLPVEDNTFWVYEDSYIKAKAMLALVEEYVDSDFFYLLFCNVWLHYYITTKFTTIQEIINPDGSSHQVTIINELYDKYKVADKAFIVSSASDGSSSSSLFTTESMNKGGFMMQDLIKTPYGEYVYSVLEQLNISVVLL